MNKGATYNVRLLEEEQFTGVYLRRFEGNEYFLIENGEIVKVEEDNLLCAREIKQPATSNELKLMLTQHIGLEDPIFEKELVYLDYSKIDPVIYIYESEGSQAHCRRREHCIPPALETLEVGATYLVRIDYSAETRFGIFVGTSPSGDTLYFIEGCKELRHWRAQDLVAFYKVREDEPLYLGEKYGTDNPLIAACIQPNWKYLYYKMPDNKCKQVLATMKDDFGIHWHPLKEEMYWGSISNPYQNKLRSGDQIRSEKHPDLILFVDRVHKDRVEMISSSYGISTFFCLSEMASFEQFMDLGDCGWHYVPKEQKVQWNLTGIYGLLDDIQKDYLECLINEDDVLHIEFLDGGFIHIYSLEGGFLRRDLLVRKHPCLTTDYNFLAYRKENGIYERFSLGYLYRITLLDGRIVIGRYRGTDRFGISFVEGHNRLTRWLPPVDISGVQRMGERITDEDCPCGYVLLRRTENLLLCARYIDDDRAIVGSVELKYVRRDPALLSGF